MERGIKQWVVQLGLRSYLNLLVLCVVAYYLVSQIIINWSQLRHYDYHQDPVYAFLSFVCLLIYFGVVAWTWKAILSAFHEKVTLRQAFRIISLSQLEKYIPGGFWSLVGQVHLGGRIGVSKTAVLGSSLLHLLFTLLTGLEIFLLWRSFSAIGEARWTLVGLLILVMVFSMTPFCLKWLFNWFLKFLSGKDLLDPVPRWTFAKTMRFHLVFICCWLWLGLSLWLFINSLTPLPARLYLAAIAAFAISWGMGVLNFIAPAGIGTREAGLVFFLKDFLPSSEALVVALGARLWVTFAELACAAAAWKADGLARKKSSPP